MSYFNITAGKRLCCILNSLIHIKEFCLLLSSSETFRGLSANLSSIQAELLEDLYVRLVLADAVKVSCVA